MEWLQEDPKRAGNPNYLIPLKWLDAHLGHLKLSEVDRHVIKAIQHAKQAEGVKPRTVNMVLQQTRVILRAALAWEWLDKIPQIKLLQEPDRRIRWLSEDEEQRLLQELPAHMQRIVVFALATGLRMSNILGLEWKQIDLNRRQAWIHADQAKAGKSIGVPLNADAMAVLAACLGEDKKHVFVFRGKPMLRVNGNAWRQALKRAGIEDFHFHDLRHTWATRHVMNGTPLHVLQELGGWNDITMLRKYAHLSVEHLHLHAGNVSRIDTNLTQTIQA
ncbi:integrase [Neisseria sp. HSC-16F19]|nr:integrase [Neisseria sp. HSC-16F19]